VIIENIGFEEIEEQGRPVPQPGVFRELLDVASDMLPTSGPNPRSGETA
jgi:hypothetical protein